MDYIAFRSKKSGLFFRLKASEPLVAVDVLAAEDIQQGNMPWLMPKTSNGDEQHFTFRDHEQKDVQKIDVNIEWIFEKEIEEIRKWD